MKSFKLILVAIILSVTFSSCTKDDDSSVDNENLLANYTLLKTLKSNNYNIEVYSEEEEFTVGYNELFIRIKEGTSENYLPNAEFSWKPIMHMTQMVHSCPKSEIVKIKNESIYKGYIVFQMPGNTDEYWELTINFSIDNKEYKATTQIDVKAPLDDKRRVNTFMGSDDSRYVLAMLPINPKVSLNDFSAVLFKMENMMNFPIVENYKVMLDPRMPGMGNHSSPNNVDLIYDTNDKTYKGKLSLTMTGYWKINLKLINDVAETIKGEDITEENPESSLFFELEF